MNLDTVNFNANQTKLSNLFLGFFEGLFIDNTVKNKEIEALIKWVEKYPEVINIPNFKELYELLIKVVKEPQFLIESKGIVQEYLTYFKSSKFFKENTGDIQRLHGVIAGVACDTEISSQEVIALSNWLHQHGYLENDPVFQELWKILKPVYTFNRVENATVEALRDILAKYIQMDNFGLPKLVVDSRNNSGLNPDFYQGEIQISGATICLTGASVRYTKAEWKIRIEEKGGIFNDSLIKKVNYLVICNKGNPHWANMSYGRKFEQALKWKNEGLDIKILTEDDFIELFVI